MPRESSGGYTKQPPIKRTDAAQPVPPAAAEIRQLAKPIDGVFVPTNAQRLARARVLTAMRNDPLLRPEKMNNEQLARLTRLPSQAKNWLAQDGFREWLVATTDVEERIEYAFSIWLDEMIARVEVLSDKDLINAGKLLADVAAKQSQKAATQQPALDAMSNDQLKKLIAGVIPVEDTAT